MLPLFFTLFSLSPIAHAVETPLASQLRLESAAAAYADTFDYYAELCAASEFRPLASKAGNGYGHAFLLVKGACADETAPLPRLKFCADGEAGVSVDSNYDNVKWTAAPSRTFMLYGDVSADSPLTEEVGQAAIAKAVASGMFKGVRLTVDPEGPHQRKGETYEQMVARWSLGTNFGSSLARNLTCVRIPLVAGEGHEKEAVVKALIHEMNRQNELAEKNHSNWDYQSNNCTDTAMNELAAIGFSHAIATGWDVPSLLKHPIEFYKDMNAIAFPYDQMLDALLWGNYAGPRSEYSGTFPSLTAKASYEKLGWLGEQPGVIAEHIPIHSFRNSIFSTDTRPVFGNGAPAVITTGLLAKFKLDALANDLPSAKAGLFRKTLSQPRYVDLSANLAWWIETYAALPTTAYNSAKLAELKRLQKR